MNKFLSLCCTILLIGLVGSTSQAAEPHTATPNATQLQLMGLDDLNLVSESAGDQIRGQMFNFNRSYSYQRFSYTKFGPGLEFGSFTSITSNNNQFPTIVHSFSFPR